VSVLPARDNTLGNSAYIVMEGVPGQSRGDFLQWFVIRAALTTNWVRTGYADGAEAENHRSS
jgi:hypothetical protein